MTDSAGLTAQLAPSKCVPGCECLRHKPMTAAVRQRMSETRKGRKHSAEARQRMTESQRSRKGRGFYMQAGYRYLTGQWDHPVASSTGKVSEHRKVLYDAIGPGPHPCHWNEDTGCGNTALEWGGPGGIHADHLDDDRLNNSPENLVPACLRCNTLRSKARRSA